MGDSWRKKIFATSLFVLGGCVLPAPAAVLSVNSLEPLRGSVAGGTRLLLDGKNLLKDPYSETVDVSIGGKRCEVETYSTTRRQIVCETPSFLTHQGKLPNGQSSADFNVSVQINREDGSEEKRRICCFTAAEESTPRLLAVYPQGIWDAATLRFIVDNKLGQAARDGAVQAIKIGPKSVLCDLDPFGEKDDLGEFPGVQYLGEGLWQFECELSAPLGTISANVTVDVTTHGNINGYALPTLQNRLSDGIPYVIQSHPHIESVSPNKGSVAGGNEIVLSGRNLAAPSEGKLEVFAGSDRCNVIDQSKENTQLTCSTEEHQESQRENRTVETEHGNMTAGGRGWILEEWLGENDFEVVKVRSPNLTEVHTGVFELPLRSRDEDFVSRMRSIFIPPRSGDFSFWLLSRERAEVKAQTSSSPETLKLVDTDGGSDHRDWYGADASYGEEVYLQEGLPVYLQILSTHYRGRPSYLSLGANMPGSGQPRLDNPDERVHIKAESSLFGHRVRLELSARSDSTQLQRLAVVFPQMDGSEVNATLSMVDREESVKVSLPPTKGELEGRIIELLGDNSSVVKDVNGPIKENQADFPGDFKNATFDVMFSSDMPRLIMSFEAKHENDTLPQRWKEQSSILRGHVDSIEPLDGWLTIYYGERTFDTTAHVPSNASASAVEEVVEKLTKKNVRVDRNAVERYHSGHSGYEWIVDFPHGDSPSANVSVSADVATGVHVQANRTSIAESELLEGSWSIIINGYGETESLSAMATANDVQAALEATDIFDSVGVAMQRFGRYAWADRVGTKWSISSSPVANNVDLLPFPTLQINSSNLSGESVQSSVRNEQKATIEKILSLPLAGEALRVPVNSSDGNLFELSSGGIPASFFSGSCECTYEASEERTPTMSSVELNHSSLTVNISGSGFDGTGASVTVGTEATTCAVEKRTEGFILCDLVGNWVSGENFISVRIKDKGLARYTGSGPFAVNLPASLESVEPSTVSSVGKTLMRINGQGFPRDCANITVKLNSTVECRAVSCSPSAIDCWVLPDEDNPPSGNAKLSVLTSDALSDIEDSLDLAFEEPTFQVYNVTPGTFGPGGANLTIWGEKLSNFAVRLYPDGRNGLRSALENSTVQISTTNLRGAGSPLVYDGISESETVICAEHDNVSESKKECTIYQIRTGKYWLELEPEYASENVPPYVSHVDIDVGLDITTVTPKNGSMAGGTNVTIKGDGFSGIPERNAVFLQVPVSTTFPNGIIQCRVKSATTTRITCTAPAHCSANAGPDDPLAEDCSLRPTSPEDIIVKVCPEKRRSDIGQIVDGLDDLGKQRCLADPTIPAATAPSFAYVEEMTPIVEDVRAEYFEPGAANLSIFVRNMPKEVAVEVSGTRCSNLNMKHNVAICILDGSPEPGQKSVHLWDPHVGNIAVSKANPVLRSEIRNLSPSASGFAGGQVLTIEADDSTGTQWGGPTTNMSVLVGGVHECPIEGVNGVYLHCRMPNVSSTVVARVYDLQDGFPLESTLEPSTREPDWILTVDELTFTPKAMFDDLRGPVGLLIDGFVHFDGGSYNFSLLTKQGTSKLWIGDKKVVNHSEDLYAPPVDIEEGFEHVWIQVLSSSAQPEIESLQMSREKDQEEGYKPLEASNFVAVKPGIEQKVQVMQNGVQANQMDECNCGTTFRRDLTPTSLSIEPATFVWKSGITVNVTTENLPDRFDNVSLSCFVGEQNCSIKDVHNNGFLISPPNMVAGEHSLEVLVGDWGSVDKSGKLRYKPRIDSVSPQYGSIYGRTELEIAGQGFAETGESNVVHVGESLCNVKESDRERIVCEIRPHTAATVDVSIEVQNEEGATLANAFEYSKSMTPAIELNYKGSRSPHEPFDVEFSLSAGAEVEDFTVIEGFIGRQKCKELNHSGSTYTCRVGGLPAGNYELAVVDGNLGAAENSSIRISLDVDAAMPMNGSVGGGTLLTISGNGFDDDNKDANVVDVEGEKCIIEWSTAVEIACRVPRSPLQNSTTAVNVTVRTSAFQDSRDSINAGQFEYRLDRTPTIASINPRRGSTAGGTELNIQGQNLDMGSDVPSVWIGKTSCDDVEVIGADQLKCRTKKPKGDNLTEPLLVTVRLDDEVGDAIHDNGDVTFEFVDLWSRKTTWGGQHPPREGESARIPPGIKVVLDETPPKLGIIFVEGVLEFDDDQPVLELHANYILVTQGGHLKVGTEMQPYKASSTATIVLHGQPHNPELPIYGAKVLALREGTIDLHGASRRPSWSKLAANVGPGEKVIEVRDEVNWQVEDEIFIASSSFFPEEHDQAIIKETMPTDHGTTLLTLDRQLSYAHLGVSPEYGGKVVDMGAEVGLITRNVRIKGDDESTRENQYGAQILFHDPNTDLFSCEPRNIPDGCRDIESSLRVENAEISQCGQAFRMGRYCLHWHLNGKASKSYVLNASVHNSFNRAVAVHGTHSVTVRNTVAYKVKGHAFFLEDGIEQGNVLEGNLGAAVRKSEALLVTDTTPAVFWITNPNNMFTDNAAAGSAKYGFWFDLKEHPTGPSATNEICPRKQGLGTFESNVAHSNFRYGMRIFPVFRPQEGLCGYGKELRTEFKNFTAYKNAQKGAIATEFGNILFTDFRIADNGGGPPSSQPIVNGKDNPGDVEFIWNEFESMQRVPHEAIALLLPKMPGMDNSVIVKRSAEGDFSTAGFWDSSRPIRGLITQSRSSNLKITNTAFVNFLEDGQGFALEACAKCKVQQGGVTTHFGNISFQAEDPSKRHALVRWSWNHQGVFLDTDYSLVGEDCEGLNFCDRSIMPGPAIVADNGLLQSADCNETLQSFKLVGGRLCRPGLVHRRFMLNSHLPYSIHFEDLLIRWQDPSNPGVTLEDAVPFSRYNDHGYQATLIAGRNYTLAWSGEGTRAPSRYRLHNIEALEERDSWLFSIFYPSEYDHFTVNGELSEWQEPPLPKAGHGSHFYLPNRTWNPFDNSNDTVHYLVVSGGQGESLRVERHVCPPDGCDEDTPDGGENIGLWSDEATWESREGGMPTEGDDVEILPGWEITLDISPPKLNKLKVYGRLIFAKSVDLRLDAYWIIVQGGELIVGTKEEPIEKTAEIVLHGDISTPREAVGATVIGSKALAAVNGGLISLHGLPRGPRWGEMAKDTFKGNTSIKMSNQEIDWPNGSEVCITTSSWNPEDYELNDVSFMSTPATVELEKPLEHDHQGVHFKYGKAELRTWPEVGLLTSNVKVRAADGVSQLKGRNDKEVAKDCRENGNGGTADCSFGCHILAGGVESELQISDVEIRYCGQQGWRPAVQMSAKSSNGSYVSQSSIVWNMDSAIVARHKASISASLILQSLEGHGVDVSGGEVKVTNNLVVHSIKLVSSNFDHFLPANFRLGSNVEARGNVGAGADRIGFDISGDDCNNNGQTANFRDNKAHATLMGLHVRGTSAGCTRAERFSSHHAWDFGIFSAIGGIDSDLELEGVIVSDTKHAALQVQRSGSFTERSRASLRDSLLIHYSKANECQKCSSLSDAGCHHNRASVSHHTAGMPSGSPSYGLVSTTFALSFVPGPEEYPWEGVMGYPLVHGRMDVHSTKFANFEGPAGICGVDSFAITNFWDAPDAFHPHFFHDIQKENVLLFKLHDGSPSWRNPTECGEAVYVAGEHVLSPAEETKDDVGIPSEDRIKLNCDGPRHVYFRDLDGSLFGQQGGTLLGYYPSSALGNERPNVMQGSPTSDEACDVWQDVDGVLCRPGINVKDFPKVEGRPIAGEFADPQLLVLESRDDDAEDRNFGPLALVDNSIGKRDLLLETADHGWCFGYACLERLSSYWGVVSAGQAYRVYPTGTPPSTFRIWFPYADPSAEVVLVLNYTTPERRFVFVEGEGRLSPTGSRLACEDRSGLQVTQECIPSVGDGRGHGAFYWYHMGQQLAVKLRGGRSLEVRTEMVVEVQAVISMDYEDFYGEEDRYASSVVNALGIDPGRLRIASVVKGSTHVTFTIGMSTSESKQLETHWPDADRDKGMQVDSGFMDRSKKRDIIDKWNDDGIVVNDEKLEEEKELRKKLLNSTQGDHDDGSSPPPASPPSPPPPPDNTGGESEPSLSEMSTIIEEKSNDGTLEQEMQALGGAFESAEYERITVTYDSTREDKEKSEESSEDNNSKSDEFGILTMALVSTGGGLLLLTAVLVSIFAARKRRSSKKAAPEERISFMEDMEQQQSNGVNRHADIDELNATSIAEERQWGGKAASKVSPEPSEPAAGAAKGKQSKVSPEPSEPAAVAKGQQPSEPTRGSRLMLWTEARNEFRLQRHFRQQGGDGDGERDRQR